MYKRLRGHRMAVAAFVLFIILVLACIIIPEIGYGDFSSLHLDQQYAPVSLLHPFSTDHLGRDMCSRIFYGGRFTLGLSLLAAAGALIVGTVIGLAAGYAGGWFDGLVTSLAEALSAVPCILLAIILEVSLGWGKGYFALAIAISSLPSVIRTVKAAVLQVRHQEFIVASRLAGKSHLYILFRHVLRNIYATVLVEGCRVYASSIVSCSIMGYLEVGISSPNPEWGRMVADYFHLIQVRPFLVLLPCLFVSASVLCVTLISQGLRDVLDPREYRHD